MLECPAGLMILQNQPTAGRPSMVALPNPDPARSIWFIPWQGCGPGSRQIHTIYSTAELRFGSGRINTIFSITGMRIRIRSDQCDSLHDRVVDPNPVGSIWFTLWQGCGSGSGWIHTIHSMAGLRIRIRSDPYDSLHDRVVDQDPVGFIWFTPWQGCVFGSGWIHPMFSICILRFGSI